jgi:hypothetical protein
MASPKFPAPIIARRLLLLLLVTATAVVAAAEDMLLCQMLNDKTELMHARDLFDSSYDQILIGRSIYLSLSTLGLGPVLIIAAPSQLCLSSSATVSCFVQPASISSSSSFLVCVVSRDCT